MGAMQKPNSPSMNVRWKNWLIRRAMCVPVSSSDDDITYVPDDRSTRIEHRTRNRISQCESTEIAEQTNERAGEREKKKELEKTRNERLTTEIEQRP